MSHYSFHSKIILIALTCVLCFPVRAQDLNEIQKLLASDGAAGRFFGYSVSISGDNAIVGAAEIGPTGPYTGAAYVFNRDGDSGIWGLMAKITAPDENAPNSFGHSVSISGDYAIVSAERDELGNQPGSAYIFYRNHGGTNAWGWVAKLTPSDAQLLIGFGYTVTISGDVALVSAAEEHGIRTYYGSVYVYHRNSGGTDVWEQVAKITASDSASWDRFGHSISISGDYAIVGAHGNRDYGTRSGSAYVFNRDQDGIDAWGQVTKIKASDSSAEKWFGNSVSISDDYAIIGAPGDNENGDGSGSAYVFYRNQGGTDIWGQTAKITASDGARGDHFGKSVSISGDYCIVGSYGDDVKGYDDKGSNSGSAYVFNLDYDLVDEWEQVAKVTASDGTTGDRFGNPVSISGNYAIVGAYYNDNDGGDLGSAYIVQTDQVPYTVSATRPIQLTLHQNTPNPFNPSTTIRFSVTQASPIRLSVYNTAGQFVRTLVDGTVEAGTHKAVWDGRDSAGRNVSSGVYLYRLSSTEETLVRKMLLVR
jgi:hypothetical protein